MLWGIRFCGGCNPRYDRSAACEYIKSQVTERAAATGRKIDFEIAAEEGEYDGLLVIGGCESCCASYEQFSVKETPVFFRKKEEMEETISKILIASEC